MKRNHKGRHGAGGLHTSGVSGSPGCAGELGPRRIEDPYAEVEDVAELDYQQRRKQALAKALDGLTEDQRRAVVLRHCRGFTVDQTAARMGTTRAAARTAEQKGLRLLRHPINRELRMYC